MPNENPDTAALDGLISDLKKNPIFIMSLASKEHFHSNFIAWLIRRHPAHFEKKMKLAFPEELEGESFDRQNPVEREKLRKDLTINLEGSEKKIIIENKVKSVPYKEQLEEYSNDSRNCHALLSLSSPGFVRKSGDKFKVENEKGEKVSWLFMDYEYFLKNFLDFKTKKDRTEKYVEDYKAFLKTLTTLNKRYFRMEQNVDFFSSQNMHKKLKEIKMHDIYHKIMCSKLEEKFKEAISQKDFQKLLDGIKVWKFEGKKKKLKEFKDPKDKIRTWTWFGSRDKTGLFAAAIELAHATRKKKEEDLSLYFELQDDKFKLFLFINRREWIEEMGNDKRLLDDYFEILEKIKEKYGLESKTYPNQKPKNAIQYKVNTFWKDRYYRYVKLNESVTVKQLTEIMEETLEHIIKSKDLQERMLEIYQKSPAGNAPA